MQHDPNNNFHHAFRSGIDFLFRIKTVPVILMKSGIGLIIVTIGGWLGLGIETDFFKFKLSESDTPEVLLYLCFFTGLVSFAVGSFFAVRGYLDDKNRKKTIVIEQRGLRFTPNSPLSDAISKGKVGKYETIMNDIRDRMKDGIIAEPEESLKRIVSLKIDLEQKTNGLNHSDVSVTYGGLMAVPFTFLTGMLLDDESSIDVYDWDRDKEGWRSIQGADDDQRFEITGLENKQEAVLAVSVSYKVDLDAVKNMLGDMPIVHMDIQGGNHACHWSGVKQQEWAKSFFETVVKLNNQGVKKIHLFIAAQNSVVFNLGRKYDVRNLPEAQIYQYERSASPAYPWAVSLPTHGKQASIIHT